MIDLIFLCLLAQGQGAGAQQIVSPPSGGVSPLAWAIICGLTTAVAALGRFCLTLYSDLKKSREDLAQSYEDQAESLRTLRKILNGGSPPTSLPPINPPAVDPKNPSGPGNGPQTG
jgi:hypothetical protein